MKILIYFAFLMYIVTSSLNAQSGYLGKTKALGFGIASNYPLITANVGPYGTTLDKGMLLPKLSVEYLRENKKGNGFFLQTEFQTLPNARTSYQSVTANSYSSIRYNDTIRSRSNSLRLSMGLKKHYNVGIIGGYIGLKGSGSVTFNKSIHSSTVTNIKQDYNTKEVTRSSKKESGATFIPSVSFIAGKTYPLSRRLILDLGFDANMTIGKFSAYKGISIKVLNAQMNHRIINSKQLLTSNGLGVYIKLYLL